MAARGRRRARSARSGIARRIRTLISGPVGMERECREVVMVLVWMILLTSVGSAYDMVGKSSRRTQEIKYGIKPFS